MVYRVLINKKFLVITQDSFNISIILFTVFQIFVQSYKISSPLPSFGKILKILIRKNVKKIFLRVLRLLLIMCTLQLRYVELEVYLFFFFRIYVSELQRTPCILGNKFSFQTYFPRLKFTFIKPKAHQLCLIIPGST